jgi:D-arabinose 1-dehydrogenase-like Zn-dependent alcohol dehydrogenase
MAEMEQTLPLESINDVFSRLKAGQVNGRVVLDISGKKSLEKSELVYARA